MGRQADNEGWFRVKAGIGRPVYGSRSYGHCSGIMVINGVTWRYRYENPGADPKSMFIKAMTPMERFQSWRKRTLFGICVGWHNHFDNNGRRWPGWDRGRPTRHPEWLMNRLLCGYFYGWRGMIIPDAPRWAKRANRIYSQKKAMLA